MSHYLVRFFRQPRSGKQQRHLMLDDASWVLGEWIGAKNSLESRMAKIGTPGFDPVQALMDDRFYEENFEDPTACVAAYEDLASRAVADGYVLVDMTDRMLDVIPDDAAPKPAWACALDQYVLDSAARKPIVGSPALEEARNEPLRHYLDALHRHRQNPDMATENLRTALIARNELDRRKVSGTPMYLWSIDPIEFEARIYQLLMQIHQQLGDTDAMFASIRKACDLVVNSYRSECLAQMQCYHLPQYREDAFETAFKYAQFGYDVIREHKDYAAYAKRRKGEVKTGKPFMRWQSMQEPSSAAEITGAEAALGVKFPDDYKAFLAERGRCKLSLMLGEETKELNFAGAPDLAIWKGVFDHWLETMGAARDNLTADWPAKHGVEARTLHSIATPWDNSSCVVMDLAPGPGHGRCFLWDHDEACDLIPIGNTFTAALTAIEVGIKYDTPPMRMFFGFMPPEHA
jgi:cell wall assembly regulator SMI1